MKKITEKYISEMLSETLDDIGENLYKGYNSKATLGLPTLGGGDAGLGDGNKFHMPSGKGQGSGQDKENQGTPAKPEYGNQENAKAASNAGPNNDTFSHEAQEDGASSKSLSLSVQSTVDGLPSMDMNTYEDPGTKENKRGKSMKKLKGGVKKLPKSVAEAQAIIQRLKDTIELFEANVQLRPFDDDQAAAMADDDDLQAYADVVPEGEVQTYTIDTDIIAPGTYGFSLNPDGSLDEMSTVEREEKSYLENDATEIIEFEANIEGLQEAVIAYGRKSKKFSIVTLAELKSGDYNKEWDLFTYEQNGNNLRLTEQIN
jgi:hypothetical protein